MSHKAEMICVGSKGTITPQHKPGSTAAVLAQGAFRPLAIVRLRHTHKPLPAGRWIIARSTSPSPPTPCCSPHG